MTKQAEKHTFQAEVSQVLSIVVDSLYSHREVFLRELISNASDACDKLSFQSLTDHELLGDDKELRIEILANKDAGTLLIRDNGIGMSHDELVENLGTIARSGSKKLMESLAAKKGDASGELSLIGQFGVGFYSSFLVADKVTVTSRAAGSDEAWQWESDAKEGFTLEPSEKETRGTNVILHLKDEAKEYLEEWTLKGLVRKYSDYVRFPIRMQVEKHQPIEGEQDSDGNPKYETVKTWETVNQANALWTRPKSEITDEQYDEFYKHLSHDWDEPLAHTHFKVEGTQEMTGLLFVPKNAPYDLFERKQRGVRLFVKRVFIMEDCEELLPEWLRFMRGVVDSEDLPLNVSREILQENRISRMIRKQVVSKTLALLKELADEGETTIEVENDDGEKTEQTRNRYLDFWKQFGRVLKEGIHFDPQHKDEIAALLRFESSAEKGLTSLHDYMARMDPEQPGIYYITADSLNAARHSPHLEALEKHGYEVLFMTDPVDEWVVQSLTEFEDKKLISAAKGALDLPETEEEKKHKEEKATELSGLIDALKSNLGTRVSDVRLTNRLTDSPACLVADEGGLSPHLERILRANGQDVPDSPRVLELNADHKVVQSMNAMAA
ncbi:MAG: molecular chaperone HtpG, partial [Planctomycetes bacterium]|nr:molecular chaperone HtpG [Planctomycetota bacterium]